MKLSNTVLVMLSAAAQRRDRGIELSAKLKGAAAAKLIDKLQSDGLVETIRARGSLPAWRRDEENRPLALRITKSGMKAIRIEDSEEASVDPTASASRAAVKRTLAAADKAPAGRQKGAPIASQPPRGKRAGCKQAQVLTMLRGPGGMTVAAIMEMTGWQPHSVRGFLAGAVRKRLGLTLVTEVVDGIRAYRIPSDAASEKVPSHSRRATA